MAESEGFEPSERFPVHTISNRAPSTTQPTLYKIYYVLQHIWEDFGCHLREQLKYYHKKRFLASNLWIKYG